RDCLHRVAQGFTFRHRRALGADVDHVRREPLTGDFEGGSGSGGVFEEKVDHSTPPERRQFLDRAFLYQRHLFGEVQDLGGLSSIKISCGQQMAHQASLPAGSLPCSMLTWFTPSISAS